MKTVVKSAIIHPQYFELIQKNYGESLVSSRYVNDTKEGMNTVLENKKISTVFFHLLEDNKLKGHIGLVYASAEEAYFGFFEIQDTQDFNDLWNEMFAEAKRLGLKKIFGPVNGTVWHPYRVISETSSEQFFVQEPLSKEEYFNLFKNINPAHIIEYHSAYRTDFKMILELTASSLPLLISHNIQIVQENYSIDLLKLIYELSVSIFSGNPGYYNLSFNDFAKLYTEPNDGNTELLIFKVLQDDKPIGFSYNLLMDKKMIMKTIGLLPEWQDRGVGYALVNKIHQFAQEKNIEKIIYALIRSDNKVKNFPKDDAVIFRKYAAFNFLIS